MQIVAENAIWMWKSYSNFYGNVHVKYVIYVIYMCRALKQRTYFNRVHGTLGQLISYLLSYSAYRRRHQIISYSDINMVCVLLCHAMPFSYMCMEKLLLHNAPWESAYPAQKYRDWIAFQGLFLSIYILVSLHNTCIHMYICFQCFCIYGQ